MKQKALKCAVFGLRPVCRRSAQAGRAQNDSKTWIWNNEEIQSEAIKFRETIKFREFPSYMNNFHFSCQKSNLLIFSWILAQNVCMEILNRDKNVPGTSSHNILQISNFEVQPAINRIFQNDFFSNIFHQDVKFRILDGKNVMSKFARIFETYSAIIIFRENAFPKTCDWIFLELFRCDAR